jgi:hypothetical protein
MTERRYTLEISETQAEVLSRATDLLSRIQAGQFKVVSDEFRDRDVPVPNLLEAEDLLRRVHVLLTGLPASSYHGIHSPELPDTARVAYDLHQVLRHRLEHDQRPDGPRYTVRRDEPQRSSHKQVLPVIRQIEAV